MLTKFIKNEKIRTVVSWILSIGLALAVGFFVAKFFIATAVVNEKSMEPTLYAGERIFVNKLSYAFKEPKRGDVVAFLPNNNKDKYYIKRIIGLPGDEIDIYDGSIYINGEKYEGKINQYTRPGNIMNYPYKVPENSYFVVGDNREFSEDSRYFEVGCVPLENIAGKALLRFFPLNKIKIIS